MFAALRNILIKRHSTRSGVRDWSTPRHLRRHRTEDGHCSLRVMDRVLPPARPRVTEQTERKKEKITERERKSKRYEKEKEMRAREREKQRNRERERQRER